MSLLPPLPRLLILATLATAACTGSAGPMGAQGSAGVSTLVTVTPEPPGANCPSGGQRIDTGADTNGNGVLDPTEVTSSTYVCNGSNGSDGSAGSNGADGSSALVSVTPEPPGANCANGGQRIDVGVDANHNGVLDMNEIDQTTYVCNGADGTNGSNGSNGTNGTNGLNSLIDVTAEPPGPNCADGGQRIDVGIDTNGDGVLEPGEVQQTAYVCNAVGLPTKVYMANWAGFDSNFSIYDIASNTWSAGPTLPVASRGQIASDGPDVYLLGTDGNVYLYTPSSNSWTIDGTGLSLSNFAFFAAADGNLYACSADTSTLNIRSGGTWSTLALSAPCSVAGGVDRGAHEIYIQTFGTAGFSVIDTLTNTLARTVANTTTIGENSSSAAPLAGQFYTRNFSGDILRVDGTSGTLTDTGVDPTQQHNGFAADAGRGVIYTESGGVFNSYAPATGALTSLAASPNETPATLTVGY